MKKVGLFVCSILTTCALMLASCGDGSNSQVPTTEAHQHVFSEWKTLADATCTEQGEQERVCACGEKENKSIPANGHTEGEWITDADATCTEDGSKHQVCSVCNETITSEALTKLGHNYSDEWITDKEETCDEDGSKSRHCSICDDKTDVTPIAALGHNYEAFLPTNLCEGELIQYKCAQCGNTYAEQLTAISADVLLLYWSYEDYYRYVQDLVEITGIKGGYGNYTITVTYTDPRQTVHTYSYSGNEEFSILKYLGGASWGVDYRKQTPPYAIIEIEDEIGFKTTYECYFPTLDRSDYLDNQNLYADDIDFNITVISDAHINKEWVVDKEASCYTDGSKRLVCTACKATLKTDTIAAAHSYSITQNAPSCVSNGTTTIVCTQCSHSQSQEWQPITFEIDRGNYYLNQGSGLIYYLEFKISNITGGCVRYDNYGNKLDNNYTVRIYNTFYQEYEDHAGVSEKIGTATSKFYYPATDVFLNSVFQIVINDGYSTYVYYVGANSDSATLLDVPVEYHSWDTNVCGGTATCYTCGQQRYVPHTALTGMCDHCGQTVYMSQVTLPTEVKVPGVGKVQSISCVVDPYTANDLYVTLTFTIEYMKFGTGKTPAVEFEVRNSIYGKLATKFCMFTEADLVDGVYVQTFTMQVLKSSEYTVKIPSLY